MRCPAHVADLVVPVIVDAVEDMFRRRFPTKMLEELLERLKQKLDATATVVFEARLARIRAAFLCSFISFVLGGFLATN